MKFIASLNENWIFRTRKVQEFTGRDVVDLAFLYLVALHILRCEYDTAPFAIKYAKLTASHSGFRAVDLNNTDLYQFLNILSDTDSIIAQQLHSKEQNNILWHDVKLNTNSIRQFLNNIVATHYNMDAQKRLLFQIEGQLHITVSNYRSLRRIAAEWNTNNIDTTGQRLVITRLLQAFRAKARRGDLLQWLEKLNNHRRYELLNVCDPETGKGCESDVTTPKSTGTEFIKALALGVLAGGLVNYALRDK